ncbi:efflux RND transporter periplasmic adaptor subunit [Sphingobacterium wenxiniae]|uniref:Membrane fusion protein, cobalt-zinc-cadmium efflux system n=1 Tax=Sphingobacterium wenxiniae TaxID=683125 RepID=A0A1I6UWN6_9SPHI|nr:efflux RND transporter periplasmic adaptor subunit [Sphingobacterium wenxiniae]SFT05871.1 membrane fusion protein, cobalt-zinc-cadmium efflux system [Sphingobacterium wenxiniae]
MKNIILIINIALLLTSCGNDNKQSDAENEQPTQENTLTLTDEQYKNAAIETAKIFTSNISSVLRLNGKIDVPPQSLVSVSVPLGGYLKSTKLLPGMHIRKGDPLAVMEDIQYIQLQQDYLTTKAQLSLTESEYNRQKELNQSKATSDKVFEQARTNYQTQLVLLKSLEEKLKLIGLNPQRIRTGTISKSINIYSPISGFVSEVNVNIGKYVNPSDILFELVNPNDIHLKLTVFEKDINKLDVGQKLLAYSNNHPQTKYPLEVILISKNISGQNAAEVHCQFEQYDKNLLPGMFMNAEIEVSAHNANVLPEEAIVRFENKHYVFVEKGKQTFEMKEVQTGNAENNLVEIINAEQFDNENIVVKNAYTLLMALKNKAED